MAKDPTIPLYAQDFYFDTLAWPEEHVGAWIRMLCYLWINGPSEPDTLACASIHAHVVVNTYKDKFIDCGDGKISSKRLEKERAKRIAHRKKQSERGKRGAAARWKKPDANAMHEQCLSYGFLEKENGNEKEKGNVMEKTKEKGKHKQPTPEVIEIVDYLNMVLGKTGKSGFRADTKETQRLIQARLNDYGIQDLKDVIELKVHEWQNDQKMCRYIRPRTLFSAANFENYLMEVNNIKDGTTKIKKSKQDGWDELIESLRSQSAQGDTF